MAGNRLHRARRSSARVSLYASLSIVALLVSLVALALRHPALLAAADYGWRPQDYLALEEVQLLQDYLRIDTTEATGSELEGAKFLAAKLDLAGIDSEILQMSAREANLIAVLEGESKEALILHSHIDVEPILERDKWLSDPFSGRIDPPWIYGRGAFDMKSVAIAQLSALLELKRSGVRLRRSVILLATSGEEEVSYLGTPWLLQYRPELVDRAWGVLTEGGVVEARGPRNIKYWGTETGQKKVLTVTACSSSRERLQQLRYDLASQGQPLMNLRVTPPVANFLDSYAPSRDAVEHRDLLARPERLIRDPELFSRLAPYHQSLLRDEISAFPVEASSNGGGFEMKMNLSLLSGSNLEEALAHLLPGWATHGVRLDVQPWQGTDRGTSTDHPIFTTIASTLADTYGPIASGPYYQMRSASDARIFRAMGIPAYGFSPFPVLTTDTVGIGGPNEGIALPAFLDGISLYVELVRRLVTETD